MAQQNLPYWSLTDFQGKNRRLVIQTRVNPEKLCRVAPAGGGGGEYWLVPDDGDLRPYGVCVFDEPDD
jgi:hypothetical protein